MTENHSVDVLIIGGGPAGLGAALAAARQGVRTLLLERHGFFGGVAAWGLGMPMNQMRPGAKPRSAIHEMLISRVLAYGPDGGNLVDHALVCNVEYLKVAALDALDAAGADYRLHGQVVDAIVTRGRITGVVLATKQGLLRIHAHCLIDATGDADVCFFAGGSTLKGRQPDGFLSPMTLLLMISNVDLEAVRQFIRDGGQKRLIELARPKYPLLPASIHFELEPLPIVGCRIINHAGTRLAGPLDATNIDDMTKAEHYSRHQALQLIAALREFGGPAFQNVQLATAGPQVAPRETRRIEGDYLLTESDAKTGARFDDAIAWRSGFLDIGFVRYESMQVHDVPYRALLPRGIEGLLAAGRCISASHVAASAGKSMGNCIATGHAAGIAAALCVRHRLTPRELAASEVRAALTADGVDLRRAS